MVHQTYSASENTGESTSNDNNNDSPEFASLSIHEQAVLLARQAHARAHAEAMRLHEVMGHRIEQEMWYKITVTGTAIVTKITVTAIDTRITVTETSVTENCDAVYWDR